MKIALFDVDGTLVNVQGAGRWALTRAFEKTFGRSGVVGAASEVVFDGRTDPLIMQDIAASAGLAGDDVEERRAEIESHYLALLEERLAETGPHAPLPGVTELVAELGRKGIASGLLTGNTRRGAVLKLGAAGIGDLFELGAYGSDGRDRAALGRLARERFESKYRDRIEPGDVVVIGDSVMDVQAARANSYRCLAVGTGWTSLEVLREAGADMAIADLSDAGQVATWIAG